MSKDITSTLVHGNGHLAALRFAYATFSIENISIAAQNQMVRSKHLDFMVQSKRYVDINKGNFKFIMPNISTENKQKMQKHWDESILLYRELINDGVKKEDARAILPANTSTNMNITGNLQAFNDMFKLRINKRAQYEIRQIAIEMYNQLSEVFPQVFTQDLFNKYAS